MPTEDADSVLREIRDSLLRQENYFIARDKANTEYMARTDAYLVEIQKGRWFWKLISVAIAIGLWFIFCVMVFGKATFGG